MPKLMISDTQVRQDAEGRYSLNDLHKASGGESKSQPAFFMRRDETKALVAEINNSANSQSLAATTSEGRNGGTFAVEGGSELYAMRLR